MNDNGYSSKQFLVKTYLKEKQIMTEEKMYGGMINGLFLFAKLQNEISWKEFEESLIYKNRFSSNHEMLSIIKDNIDICTINIPIDTEFFRARVYSQEQLFIRIKEFLIKYLKITTTLSSYKKRKIITEIKKIDLSEQLSTYLLTAIFTIFGDENEISRVFNGFLNELDNFYGYDAEGSTAPPASIVPEGRANPAKIRYLYMAEDIDTAIYEVRPIIGQIISVATMEVVNDLKIFDFTVSIQDKNESEIKLDRQSLFDVIGNAFAKPNYDKQENYIPTQFLSEFIKNQGFDGIKYKSSLHKNGINILIFEPDNCKAKNSDIHLVNTTNISYDKIDLSKMTSNETEIL